MATAGEVATWSVNIGWPDQALSQDVAVHQHGSEYLDRQRGDAITNAGEGWIVLPNQERGKTWSSMYRSG